MDGVVQDKASPWLSIEQAAERLSMSKSFVKKAVAENRFPHRHLGRRVVCHVDEVDAWALSKPGVAIRGDDLLTVTA